MNWFSSRRSTTVDAPTVELTVAEREAFSELAAVYERRRRARHAIGAWCSARGTRVGSLVWCAGAFWILGWMTTSAVVAALGALPFLLGMRAIVTAPAATQRARRFALLLFDRRRA